MRPGISCSARRISLRPRVARARSRTLNGSRPAAVRHRTDGSIRELRSLISLLSVVGRRAPGGLRRRRKVEAALSSVEPRRHGAGPLDAAVESSATLRPQRKGTMFESAAIPPRFKARFPVKIPSFSFRGGRVALLPRSRSCWSSPPCSSCGPASSPTCRPTRSACARSPSGRTRGCRRSRCGPGYRRQLSGYETIQHLPARHPGRRVHERRSRSAAPDHRTVGGHQCADRRRLSGGRRRHGALSHRRSVPGGLASSASARAYEDNVVIRFTDPLSSSTSASCGPRSSTATSASPRCSDLKTSSPQRFEDNGLELADVLIRQYDYPDDLPGADRAEEDPGPVGAHQPRAGQAGRGADAAQPDERRGTEPDQRQDRRVQGPDHRDQRPADLYERPDTPKPTCWCAKRRGQGHGADQPRHGRRRLGQAPAPAPGPGPAQQHQGPDLHQRRPDGPRQTLRRTQ